MEGLTTKVKLPSNGRLNPSLGEPIVMDMMGFEEEKVAFGADTDEALDEVLKMCIKSPENFDVTALTPADRRFLLMKLRIHTYGDEYHVKANVNGVIEDVKISLDDIEVKELPDDFEIPKGKLPVAGNEVVVKVLTVGEIRKIESICRDKADKFGSSYKELRYETMRAKRIATIDGEKKTTDEVLRFLKGLKGKDLAYLDYLNNQVAFGYSNFIDVKINGVWQTVPVVMTGEFFRPRFDDRSTVKSRSGEV